MDRAPLPPHERPWRHPSELGPPEHEPTPTGGRVLIVTTATLSLLLIGVLAISMTPDRSTSPESVASTISGLRTVPATAAAMEQPSLPMVTPLGDDGWAVTTKSALAGRSGSVQARLPSGDVVDVEIIATDHTAGLTIVSLPVADDGYELAAAEPAPSDTVLVHTDPPLLVTMVELAALDVDEATPVLDEAGHLLGLCARERDRTALRTVATMPDDHPATSVAATQPTTAATTTTTTTTSTTITVASTTTSSAPAGAVVTSSVPAGWINGGDGATTAPG